MDSLCKTCRNVECQFHNRDKMIHHCGIYISDKPKAVTNQSICKTCSNTGCSLHSKGVTVYQCAMYIHNIENLCDTCIIKNCTAGEVVYGKGKPVLHCEGHKRIKSNVERLTPESRCIEIKFPKPEHTCKTCDRQYCTRRGFITDDCEAFVVKASAMPDSLCNGCKYRHICPAVFKITECTRYEKAIT